MVLKHKFDQSCFISHRGKCRLISVKLGMQTLYDLFAAKANCVPSLGHRRKCIFGGIHSYGNVCGNHQPNSQHFTHNSSTSAKDQNITYLSSKIYPLTLEKVTCIQPVLQNSQAPLLTNLTAQVFFYSGFLQNTVNDMPVFPLQLVFQCITHFSQPVDPFVLIPLHIFCQSHVLYYLSVSSDHLSFPLYLQ